LINQESSGKWPDELECIKRLKTAFYMKIVQLLRKSYGLTAFTHLNYCDIFYKGYVFRLSAYTMNEVFCLKNYTNEQGFIMPREMRETIDYEKHVLYLPKLTSIIYNLHQKNKCFSSVTRLAKRWLSSQFLVECFDDITIDLICSFLFMDDSPYEQPRSTISGLVKFLRLISNFDWKNEILIVNFNNELKCEDLDSIKTTFQKNRKNLPPACLVTPYDGKQNLTESIWSLNRPSVQELCRTVLLAKQSYKYLKYCLENFESNEIFKVKFLRIHSF
jgi:U3 small nucleolar RNA-associated protein 22